MVYADTHIFVIINIFIYIYKSLTSEYFIHIFTVFLNNICPCICVGLFSLYAASAVPSGALIKLT